MFMIAFRIAVIVILAIQAAACERDEHLLLDNDKVIDINEGVAISNVPNMNDPDLNLVRYEEFLKYLASSSRYIMVTQEEFESAWSPDKVIVSLRHDVDRHLNGAMKIAYREHRYGIRSTFYILHTAEYYGSTSKGHFERNNRVLDFLKKIQDAYGHEVSFHNDLVTLQLVYDIDPRPFLKGELSWLRDNGIRIAGSVAITAPHQMTEASDFLVQGQSQAKASGEEIILPQPISEGIKIIKDKRENYALTYDGDYLVTDYNFSDVKIMPDGRRWHMALEDFDKIPAGKKVIILIHPHFWD
ncbi:MAG: hypothetical protein MUE32_08620 [Bacteroidales bacterium]|nr:hypothetical protein [Bacteroidales bacterium]